MTTFNLRNIFRENYDFLFFFGVLLKFQKNRSQKLSMLEEKQGQFWNLHVILNRVSETYFQFSFYFSDDRRFSNKPTIIRKIFLVFLTLGLQ